MITYQEMQEKLRTQNREYHNACYTCMGNPDCCGWLDSLGHPLSEDIKCINGKYYANAEECKATLKWHNDKYGSIQQETVVGCEFHPSGSDTCWLCIKNQFAREKALAHSGREVI